MMHSLRFPPNTLRDPHIVRLTTVRSDRSAAMVIDLVLVPGVELTVSMISLG
jgi:hypothetical protein